MRFFGHARLRWAGCLLAGVLFISSEAGAQAPVGNALSFDGQGDGVNVPYDPSFPTEVYSVSAWIRTPQPTGNAAIIGRGEDNNSYNFAWQLYVNGAGNLTLTLENEREQNFCYPVSCRGGEPVSNCVVGDTLVADNEWHHVAATRDADGVLAMYVDGVEVVSCSDTGVPSSTNFQFLTIGFTHFFIGRPPGGVEPPAWFFPGEIDEPAMWNIALTGQQIAEVFLEGVDPNANGLVGYWHFDEGAGQQVTDLSPSSNHGFLGHEPTVDVADPTWIEL